MDSKVAIQATQKAGKTGRARTRALAALGTEIHTRNSLYGSNNVQIAWVKSHIGIPGNEEADEMARAGAAKDSGGEITEGGIKQRQKEVRKANRTKEGYRCVTDWDRKTATTYTHLRTNRGNLMVWRKMIGKAEDDTCRKCGMGQETGDHVVFECGGWEELRVSRDIGGTNRKWQTWEDLDLDIWVDKGKDGKEGIDHVFRFFSTVGLG